MRRWHKYAGLRYSTPTPKLLLLGIVVGILNPLMMILEGLINTITKQLHIRYHIDLTFFRQMILIVALIILLIMVVELLFRSNKRRIKYKVMNKLCNPKYGNPLTLTEGELIPTIKVTENNDSYFIKIISKASDYKKLTQLDRFINDALDSKFSDYSVTTIEEDIASKFVIFKVEDVVKKSLNQTVYETVDEMLPITSYEFKVNDNYVIDYSKVPNSSALVVGKTRSGKTTGILSVFILPVLNLGRDKFGSKVVIIDPKNAELSECLNVLAPTLEGDITDIHSGIKGFNDLRIKRQKILNDLCKKNGKPYKWWEVGMKPSLLFIDEFITLQGLYPKKSDKTYDYNVSDFENLIKQIATQGASAGCFLIISTAQASVTEGGLSSIINNSCGIRVLFKPSRDEGKFLWDSTKLETMKNRSYKVGEAWITVDDGTNHNVSGIRFPHMKFGEYKALNELMKSNYNLHS